MTSQTTRRQTGYWTWRLEAFPTLCTHSESCSQKDALLRRIFLRLLPEDVHVQVAALEAESLTALARKADIIVAAKRVPSMINTSAPLPRKIVPSRIKSPLSKSDRTDHCWYHAKFGSKAKSCRPPCTYTHHHPASGNGQAST